jgi:hypothetical protein
MSFYIDQLEGKGRCLKAGRKYAMGELVLTEYAECMTINNQFIEVGCGYCGKLCVDEAVFQISADDRVKYCSGECLTLDYPVHKEEIDCLKLLKNLTGSFYGNEPLRLILRIIAMKKQGVASRSAQIVERTSYQSQQRCATEAIFDLEAAVNEQSFPIAMEKEINVLADKIEKIAKIKKLYCTAEEAKKLLLIIRCNAHSIYNKEKISVALGLFPTICMINHSCVPNCTHYFRFQKNKSPQMVIRAIRDINIDEELTYSYVPLYQSTTARNRQLMGVYSFYCVCDRCTRSPLFDEGLDVELTSSVQLQIDETFSVLFRQSSSNDAAKCPSVELRNRLLSSLSHNCHSIGFFSHPSHKTFLQLYVCFLRTCIKTRSFLNLQLASVLGILAIGCIHTFVEGIDFETADIEGIVAEAFNLLSIRDSLTTADEECASEPQRSLMLSEKAVLAVECSATNEKDADIGADRTFQRPSVLSPTFHSRGSDNNVDGIVATAETFPSHHGEIILLGIDVFPSLCGHLILLWQQQRGLKMNSTLDAMEMQGLCFSLSVSFKKVIDLHIKQHRSSICTADSSSSDNPIVDDILRPSFRATTTSEEVSKLISKALLTIFCHNSHRFEKFVLDTAPAYFNGETVNADWLFRDMLQQLAAADLRICRGDDE